MLPKITKILYATDLSASANNAFGYALCLAVNHSAKLSIVNVYEKLSNNVNMQMRNINYEAARERLTELVKTQLGQYLKKEDFDECQYTKYVENIYVTAGMPVTAILTQAREGKYDLIVMGTHGHGFLFSALIGSNAQKMVQESEIPVLVVRLQD